MTSVESNIESNKEKKESDSFFEWVNNITNGFTDDLNRGFNELSNQVIIFLYNRMIGDKIEVVKKVALPMLKQALPIAEKFTNEGLTKLDEGLKNPEIREKISSEYAKINNIKNSFNDIVKEVKEAENKTTGGTGGAPLKKLTKTKLKQRIHKSIKNFHKTNNLKTLKREIQIMKRRFSRGKK